METKRVVRMLKDAARSAIKLASKPLPGQSARKLFDFDSRLFNASVRLAKLLALLPNGHPAKAVARGAAWLAETSLWINGFMEKKPDASEDEINKFRLALVRGRGEVLWNTARLIQTALDTKLAHERTLKNVAALSKNCAPLSERARIAGKHKSTMSRTRRKFLSLDLNGNIEAAET